MKDSGLKLFLSYVEVAIVWTQTVPDRARRNKLGSHR